MKRTLVLDSDNVKQAVKIMMAESDVNSMASLARVIDKKETTFRSSLTNNAIRLSDFISISNSMGYEVVVKEKSNT